LLNSSKLTSQQAKLDGPLIDLEIAIIEGMRLGFGYNSFVRSPSVQELALFPFINDVGVGGAGMNPMVSFAPLSRLVSLRDTDTHKLGRLFSQQCVAAITPGYK
jgi:hypothetical protein